MATETESHKGIYQFGWKMRNVSEERLHRVVPRAQLITSEESGSLSLKWPWHSGLRAVRHCCSQSLDHSLLQRWRDWGSHWIFQVMPSSSAMVGLMNSRGVMHCNSIRAMVKPVQSTLPVLKRSGWGCSVSFRDGIWMTCSMCMRQASSGSPSRTMVCWQKGCLGGNWTRWECQCWWWWMPQVLKRSACCS